MDDFKVEIKFPRGEDSNPNLVTITGHDEQVLDAKDHLLNLEEEYVSGIFILPINLSNGALTNVVTGAQLIPRDGFDNIYYYNEYTINTFICTNFKH